MGIAVVDFVSKDSSGPAVGTSARVDDGRRFLFLDEVGELVILFRPCLLVSALFAVGDVLFIIKGRDCIILDVRPRRSTAVDDHRVAALVG